MTILCVDLNSTLSAVPSVYFSPTKEKFIHEVAHDDDDEHE